MAGFEPASPGQGQQRYDSLSYDFVHSSTLPVIFLLRVYYQNFLCSRGVTVDGSSTLNGLDGIVFEFGSNNGNIGIAHYPPTRKLM